MLADANGDAPPSLPPVRRELKVHIRRDSRVVVEDPIQGKHYRFGEPEYAFFAELARGNDAASAHESAKQRCPTWGAESSRCLLSWMAKVRLFDVGSTSQRGTESPKPRKPLSPLFFRLGFRVHQPTFDRLLGWTKPLVRAEMAVLLAALIAFASWVIAADWAAFVTAYTDLFTPWRAVQVAGTWALLKATHELAHAVVCRALGGRIKNAGVAFVFGFPLPFVDLSESCRFPARTQRVGVALAGVFAESVVAAGVILLWYGTRSPTLHSLAANTALTVVVGALLFNLNPLMKYDGYYVLMECLRADNLYERGSRYASARLRRVFFGATATQAVDAPWYVRLYGVASFVWKTIALGGMAWALVLSLHGVGVLLVASALFSWGYSAMEARREQRKVAAPGVAGNPSGKHRALRAAVATAAFLSAMCVLPAPSPETAHAVVEYDPPCVIRNLTDGFVERIHVADYQEVSQGDLLATLSNDTLELDLLNQTNVVASLEQQLRSARLRQDGSLIKGSIAALDGEKERLAELRRKSDALEIRSGADGVVVSRGLATLEGTYLTEGTAIAAVGRQSVKRLRLLVNQTTATHVETGDSFRFLSVDGTGGEALVTRIFPRATRRATHSALGAQNGGPLPVTATRDQEVTFCEPQTVVTASLDAETSRRLRSGQRVIVNCKTRRSLGSWLYVSCLDRIAL